MINQIAKFIKILNSEANPSQISLALCLALIAGLTPLMNLHNILVLFLVLTLRVNLATFLLGMGLFSGFAWMLDGTFHTIGLRLLNDPSLQTLWTQMYNSDFWQLTHFNNTVQLGSLIVSLILFIPLYIISLIFIKRYRSHITKWAKQTRILQMIKGSKIYKTYRALSDGGQL